MSHIDVPGAFRELGVGNRVSVPGAGRVVVRALEVALVAPCGGAGADAVVRLINQVELRQNIQAVGNHAALEVAVAIVLVGVQRVSQLSLKFWTLLFSSGTGVLSTTAASWGAAVASEASLVLLASCAISG